MTSNGHQSGRPLRAGDPRELDGYRIVRRLGHGGMGTVYLAEDPGGRLVAVKLINAGLADDEPFRLRFAREVESARRVARFSTAAVIDARLEGDPLFIVSEYVPGPNLDEAIRADGPMRGGTLDSLAMGVAAALTAIHGSGVVHRDLKPSNVLLSPVGPKVIDFGIARALDDARGGVTRSSQLMGTPSYTAPELLLGQRATTAADVFAWGCLVAFSGTGRAPFDAPTIPAVLHNISTAPPRLDGLDPGLLDLVGAALDKNPGNRPTSQQILARLTGQAQPEESHVSRTITNAWAPPGGAPVLGAPPQETAPAPWPGGRYSSDPRYTHSGDPGRPGTREPAGGAGPDPGRRRVIAIGAAATAGVLIAGAGAVVLLNRSEEVPHTVSVYDIDFSTDPEWGNVYEPDVEDGYWMEQRGYLLQLDPAYDTEANRGTRASLTTDDEMPDRVVVSSTAYVVEGPAQATFGVQCWDNDGEDERTRYEALLRYDGERAEIRRMSEVGGDRILVESTEFAEYRPYPALDEEARGEDYDEADPYGFDAGTVPTNTVALSCEYFAEDATDGGGERMELSMWVNGEHVLTTVDEEPLPDDGEEVDERRQTGVVTRPGSSNEPLGVLFTDFSIGEIPDEAQERP